MNMLSSALLTTLETALNYYLHLDPETLKRLGRLQDKVIAIELRGLNITFYALPGSYGLRLHSSWEDEVDTTISGTPLAMTRMGLGDSSQALFSGDVTISGDVETGQQFKRILDSMDIDWEEQLASFTGDIIAHRTGNLVRDGLQWGRQLLDTLQQDISEYLQEESRILPSRTEITPFMDEVDRLRDDTARLEARIKRLQKRLSEREEGGKQP